ncbi:MAG: type II toxin-antitoxin system HicA family toxin [Dehalococcoidia bacterium]|jgi:predicted RNA binding protein YcfA (HicA-like mRNA interferase family)
MTGLPGLRVRVVVKGLTKLGFEKVRQKGSHAIFHHSDCRRATLPVHPNEELSPYFLSDVLKQLFIPEEAFLKAIGHKH